MRHGLSKWGGLRGVLTAVALGCAGGCLSELNPINVPGHEHYHGTHLDDAPPPPPPPPVPCASVHPACKSHVYVFLINGCDPLDCTNMTGLRDWLNAIGFIKTCYGQIYHLEWMSSELHRAYHEAPNARFVVLAYGMGARYANELLASGVEEPVPIDLVIYFEASKVQPPPKNVERVITISAGSLVNKGEGMEGATNLTWENVKPSGTPTAQQTLDLLVHELTEIAVRVPVVSPWRAADPDQLPKPRPLMPRADEEPKNEGTFLDPREPGNDVLPPRRVLPRKTEPPPSR
jgi:hypothetical protein